MEVLEFEFKLCGCSPSCDIGSGSGLVRCLNCGKTQAVTYSDEPPAGLETFGGGEGADRWACQVFDDAGVELLLYPEEPTAETQWLHDIDNRLLAGDYVFRSPKGTP